MRTLENIVVALRRDVERARSHGGSKYEHVSGSRAANRPVRLEPVARMRQVWVAPDGSRSRCRRVSGSIRERVPR